MTVSPVCQQIIKYREDNKLPLYDFRPKTHNKSPPIYFIEQLAKYSTNYNTNHTTELHSILYNKFSTSIYKVNDIIIGNGLTELLFTIQLAFDGIIFYITPTASIYRDQITVLGKSNNIIEIHTTINNGWKVNPDDLENILSLYKQYQKMIIINNPHYPTGIIYNPDELLILSRVLAKHNVIILSDESYHNINHFNEIISISEYAPHLTIRASSISKDIGGEGYRLGWVTFPRELNYFYKTCSKIAKVVYNYSAIPIQNTVADLYKRDEVLDNHYRLMNIIYQWTMDRISIILRRTNLKFIKPMGGWHILLDFSYYRNKIGVKNGIDLCEFLLNRFGIICSPGENYGIGGLNACFGLTELEIGEHITVDNIQYDLDKIIMSITMGIVVLTNFLNNL